LPAGSSDLPGSSASRAIAPLFGLAPDGVCPAVSVARNAVGSYPTASRPPTLLAKRAPFHHRLIRRPSRYKSETLRPCGHEVGRRPSAVCSLWHFPSPRGVRPLAGILLFGARTFLCASELCSDCPASFGMDYRIGKPGSPDFSCGVTLIRCAAKCQPSQQHRSRPLCPRPPAKLSSAQANCAATARPASEWIIASESRGPRTLVAA
jgi:hypothetical protein